MVQNEPSALHKHVNTTAIMCIRRHKLSLVHWLGLVEIRRCLVGRGVLALDGDLTFVEGSRVPLVCDGRQRIGLHLMDKWMSFHEARMKLRTNLDETLADRELGHLSGDSVVVDEAVLRLGLVLIYLVELGYLKTENNGTPRPNGVAISPRLT